MFSNRYFEVSRTLTGYFEIEADLIDEIKDELIRAISLSTSFSNLTQCDFRLMVFILIS